MLHTDVLIIGAGAAGLMCAATTARSGRQVMIVDHANKPGKKILMSGGGRCNFTNLDVQAHHFISHNPHFCRSALSRYTPQDFIQLVERHHIPYHEKKLGQLFCDHKSKAVLQMLLHEVQAANASIHLNCHIQDIRYRELEKDFILTTSLNKIRCKALVVASGGLSIPSMGASPFGYRIAEQFDIKIWPTRAGLVALTLQPHQKQHYAPLTGISVPCTVTCGPQQFSENLLFTHRGLSGPAILQISSYWQPGQTLEINCLPGIDLKQQILQAKHNSKQLLQSLLSQHLTKRHLAQVLPTHLLQTNLQNISVAEMGQVAEKLQAWKIKPNATEGYRTAEVTLGGVDCDAISSKTFACKHIPSLYFIGEVLDVTGWLGGYNFQWAWSSAVAAGQALAIKET